MARPTFPPGETEFVAIRVAHNEDGVVELRDSEIAEYLRETSENVSSILSPLPRVRGREHTIFKPQVAQTFETILRVFEIEAPAVATSRALEMRMVLRDDPHGLRLTYVHPALVSVRCLDVDKSIALERPDAYVAPEPTLFETTGSRVEPGPSVAFDASRAVEDTLEDARQEPRERFAVLATAMTGPGGQVDALKTGLTTTVCEVATLKAEFDSLKRTLGEMQRDLARLNDGAAPPTVDGTDVDGWMGMVERYVHHFGAAIECLSSSPEQEQLRAMETAYTAQLHLVRRGRGSKSLSGDARAAMRSTSSVWLRDQTIRLVDLTGKIVRPGEEGAFEGALAGLAALTGLEPIVPEPGDRVDPSVHEFQPQGVWSEHPRGTVTRVLRRGYRYDGQPFRRARVELSRGSGP